MAFSIKFLSESASKLEMTPLARMGEIKIGDFQERFSASLSYWNVDRYVCHWRQAVQRIVGADHVSCLITSMHDPATANFIFWWPMHRIGETVFIQNQVLFLDSIKSGFDEANFYRHVPERTIVNDEGVKISEWSISIEELKAFLREDE